MAPWATFLVEAEPLDGGDRVELEIEAVSEGRALERLPLGLGLVQIIGLGGAAGEIDDLLTWEEA